MRMLDERHGLEGGQNGGPQDALGRVVKMSGLFARMLSNHVNTSIPINVFNSAYLSSNVTFVSSPPPNFPPEGLLKQLSDSQKLS